MNVGNIYYQGPGYKVKRTLTCSWGEQTIIVNSSFSGFLEDGQDSNWK